METFAHGGAPMRNSGRERLGHVVGMDMVHCFQPKIRERQFFSTGERAKNLRIEIAGGINRRPARADDVPGMQDGGGKTPAPGLVQE